jgi:2-polyprenyl-6-methoxyphenol hydroxylase-like FAD-dependent oxidoreductase
MSNIPEELKTDGTYVIKPLSPESKFYIIASPRPESEEGMSISLVCYDEILIKYPWLAPPADLKTGEHRRGSWEYEYSALPASLRSEGSLVDNLKKLFEEEFPMFYRAIKHDEELFQSARINRRVTWLKMNAEEGSYSTKDGKVTLIGDSAHAMTPSLGEGCNTALDSAVKLVNSIKAEMERKGEGICSMKTISDAFTQYGRSRPSETRQLQESSAARSMGSKQLKLKFLT